MADTSRPIHLTAPITAEGLDRPIDVPASAHEELDLSPQDWQRTGGDYGDGVVSADSFFAFFDEGWDPDPEPRAPRSRAPRTPREHAVRPRAPRADRQPREPLLPTSLADLSKPQYAVALAGMPPVMRSQTLERAVDAVRPRFRQLWQATQRAWRGFADQSGISLTIEDLKRVGDVAAFIAPMLVDSAMRSAGERTAATREGLRTFAGGVKVLGQVAVVAAAVKGSQIKHAVRQKGGLGAIAKQEGMQALAWLGTGLIGSYAVGLEVEGSYPVPAVAPPVAVAERLHPAPVEAARPAQGDPYGGYGSVVSRRLTAANATAR